MKKILAVLFAALTFTAGAAYAEGFNYNAFMGEWTSAKNTEYSKLYINYCDGADISVTFKQYANGAEPFVYDIYAGKMDGGSAKLLFDYTDEYGTRGTGYILMDFYVDNIWMSAYGDDGRTLSQGMYKNGAERFNPYASPFSYNVSVALNGSRLQLGKGPFIINGSTYVPLRGVFDAMNLNVYWDDVKSGDERTQLITASRNSTIAQFVRKDNGQGFRAWRLSFYEGEYPDTGAAPARAEGIDAVQPIILDGTAYVPLRIIAEGFNSQVGWDDASKTALITADVACDTKKTDADAAAVQAFTLFRADEYASAYAGMTRVSSLPLYNYKSKYYVYVQEGKAYKLHYNGAVEEMTD